MQDQTDSFDCIPEVSVLKQPLESRLPKTRKAGDIEELRRTLWRAVRAAEQIMYQENATPELVFKSIYALSQAASSYMKALGEDELREEVEALKAELAELRGSTQLRKVV